MKKNKFLAVILAMAVAVGAAGVIFPSSRPKTRSSAALVSARP